jgi:hypothetical protein
VLDHVYAQPLQAGAAAALYHIEGSNLTHCSISNSYFDNAQVPIYLHGFEQNCSGSAITISDCQFLNDNVSIQAEALYNRKLEVRNITSNATANQAGLQLRQIDHVAISHANLSLHANGIEA